MICNNDEHDWIYFNEVFAPNVHNEKLYAPTIQLEVWRRLRVCVKCGHCNLKPL